MRNYQVKNTKNNKYKIMNKNNNITSKLYFFYMNTNSLFKLFHLKRNFELNTISNDDIYYIKRKYIIYNLKNVLENCFVLLEGEHLVVDIHKYTSEKHIIYCYKKIITDCKYHTPAVYLQKLMSYYTNLYLEENKKGSLPENIYMNRFITLYMKSKFSEEGFNDLIKYFIYRSDYVLPYIHREILLSDEIQSFIKEYKPELFENPLYKKHITKTLSNKKRNSIKNNNNGNI